MNWKIVNVVVENGSPKRLVIENDAGERHTIDAEGKTAPAPTSLLASLTPTLVSEKMIPAFAQGLGLGAGSYAGHAAGQAAGAAIGKVVDAVLRRIRPS